MKKLILFVIAIITTAIIISCTSDSSVNDNKVKEIALIPDVEWINRDGSREPQGIDSIEIVISSSSMGSNMVKKFPYINAEGKKEGTISGVPTGIVINVTLTALDSLDNIIYSGTVEANTSNPVGASMDVSIEATQVSPQSPTNLNTNALSHSIINLIWSDNSDNESNFIIERRLSDSLKPFLPVDTVGADVNNYTDNNLQHSTVYVYRVIAMNGSGVSIKYTNIDSAETEFKDTIPPVIKITSHDNPDTVSSNKIQINGSIKDTSDIKEMFLNNLLIVPDNGIWSVPNVPLLEGLNTFLIKAIDNSDFENEVVETLNIVYDPTFVDTTNDAPYFTISNSILEADIRVGNDYERILKADDPDAGDEIHFVTSSTLTLVEDTIKWQATISDTGDNHFWAVVVDAAGASSDTLRWIVTVSDSSGSTENNNPVFETKATDLPTVAHVGKLYSATVIAKDVDPGDNITYSKLQGPNSMTVDAQTGIIYWTPDTADTGASISVQIEAKDDSSATDLLSWTINVAKIVEQNNPPKFNKTKADLDRNIILGLIYNDSITVTDSDSDAELTYTCETNLENFFFNGTGKKALMSWNVNIAGSHEVKLKVTDQHGASDSITYIITVPVNSAPVIETPLEDLEFAIYPGDNYLQAIKVSDPENHSITFKEMIYPNGMTFKDNGDNTDSINWTPTIGEIGSHKVTIKVTDAFDSTAEITWTINVLNRAPKFITDSASISGQTIFIGHDYSQKLEANDLDNHSVTYFILEPNDNSITINQDIVTWTPDEDMLGLKTIKAIVTDSTGGFDTLQWTLTVDFDPPVWAYDTVYALTGQEFKLPIHIPNREMVNCLNTIQFTPTNNINFQKYSAGNTIKEYDTLSITITQTSDTTYLFRSIIQSDYGIDTTEPIFVKFIDSLNVLNMFDSTAWSMYTDNYGSTMSGGTNGLIHFSSTYNKNIMVFNVNKLNDPDPIDNEYYYAGIHFIDSSNYSNLSAIEISYKSDIPIYLKLMQSDILDGYEWEYTLPAQPLGKSLSLPISENVFSQPPFVNQGDIKPLDVSKVHRIDIHFMDEYNSQQSQQLKDEVTINDLKFIGYIPKPK